MDGFLLDDFLCIAVALKVSLPQQCVHLGIGHLGILVEYAKNDGIFGSCSYNMRISSLKRNAKRKERSEKI